MKHHFFMGAFLVILGGAVPLSAAPPAEKKPVTRIAFGSCAHQDRLQPIWDAILKTRPDIFILAGDNIYADTEVSAIMKDSYRLLGEQIGFQRLRKSVLLLSIWDDHDFGVNDGGAEFAFKDTSQKIFLDFFEAPQDDARRKRSGLYTSEMVGPPGQNVQILLLDTRYFRSPLKSTGRKHRYLPDRAPEKTLLGETQWTWLENELKKPAQLRFIVSSIQVIAKNHPFEKWANLPLEQEKLFGLIRKTKAQGVIFLSGDRHFSELSVLRGQARYPFYDLTSSSLNASRMPTPPEKNSHRVGDAVGVDNFGLVSIDWKTEGPLVTLEIRDEKGISHLKHESSFPR